MAAPEESGALPSLGEMIANRLRQVRKASGLTLLDVANRCGTTPQTIQRLETANMTLSIGWVEKMATALDIEPHTLFSDPETPAHVFRARVANIRDEVGALRSRTEGFAKSLDDFLQVTHGLA